MIQESRKVNLGHHLLESRNGLLWLDVLLSPRLLNEWVLSLAAISLGLTVICLFKKGPAQQQLLGCELTLWAWTILYFTFLILRVNFREPHYLLPIVPILIIVAAHPISQVVSRFKRAEVNPWMTRTASVVVVLVVCLLVPNALVRASTFRESLLTSRHVDGHLRFGRWLEANYQRSTRILYDHYSYVPPSFPNADTPPDIGGTIELLRVRDPQVVIVSKKIAARFSEISSARNYVRGASKFLKKNSYYEGMRHGKLGYALVRDFGDVQVYAKFGGQL